ncbi:Putative DASH complex subunit Spc19 protein [Septoria linicola]|uniref:DASH complex subunit SPC19 n=1 Tax=Septoria linicola TaxID=215465 RepID=A0A9Q9AKL9_9PEZI|nr:putative DASH complex subunit Spc19 protein [Septoria linicola]USW50765.1 Putative DASH complex subunit Spc19 protein [Septoria linicola]
MDSSTQNALSGCVTSLRSSMQLLESSINILDSGVSDYPRLAKVLQTTRHFELVSENDLTAAQSTLLSEIQPEVTNLLARVETYLDKLERREQSLMAKAELQEGRLAQPSRASSGSKSPARRPGAAGLGNMDEMKMQQLRQKKERLSYAVGRLELQASQRQRQLRKSMAAQ